jgi:chemotaxis response regulator CheB
MMIAETDAEAHADDDDVVVIEHGNDPASGATAIPPKRGSVAGTPGSYTLNRGHGGQIIPCSIVKMTPMTITFDASVAASVGDWVVARFEHLGRFEGPILRISKRAVSMRIVATQQERDKIAAKLAWIEDRSRAERRRFERFVPYEPHSVLSLSTGDTLPCTLIDYSIGGAAVFADVTPAQGTALKIAQVVAQVVRHFDGGFAVSFAAVQDSRSVAALLSANPSHTA